jgi:hypothetical protein
MATPDTTKPIPVESWPAGLRELRSWVKGYGWLVNARQHWPLEDNPAATFIEFKAQRPDGYVAVQASWSNDFGARSTLHMSSMLMRWPRHNWQAISLKSAIGVIEAYGRARCVHCGATLDYTGLDEQVQVYVHHKTRTRLCTEGDPAAAGVAERKEGS